jgi:hypothetical protein
METAEEDMQREIVKRQAYNRSMGERGKLELCSPAAKNFIDRQIQQNQNIVSSFRQLQASRGLQ